MLLLFVMLYVVFVWLTANLPATFSANCGHSDIVDDLPADSHRPTPLENPLQYGRL
jgi:hypothetical protein